MLNASSNYKAFSGPDLEILAAATDLQKPRHDVYDLIVWMAVAGAHPSFLHPMLGEKQLVVIGADAA